MNDIIIIITRKNEDCAGNQREWRGIWECGTDKWLAIYNEKYEKSEFENDAIIDVATENIMLVVFYGEKVNNYGKLDGFLSKIKNRNLLIAAHPGGATKLEDVKRTLCNSMKNEVNKKIINDAVGYTLGCQERTSINHEVARFAVSPSQATFEALRQFPLNKKQKPHLIALSILCQGYLAVHEKIDLPEGISISEDKKGNTIKRDWWKPALGDVINERKRVNESEIYEQLKVASENFKVYEKITNLGNAIQDDDKKYFDNGKLKEDDINIQVFTNLVIEAYGQLTKII